MMDEVQVKLGNNRCEEVQDLIPAYSMGITDSAEQTWVQTQLADCPEALADLEVYTELAEAMLLSAPPLQAPKGIVENILKQSPAITSAPKSKVIPFPNNRWQSWGIAVAILLLVATNLYWFTRLQQLEDQIQQVQTVTNFSDFISQDTQEVLIGQPESQLAKLSWSAGIETDTWIGIFPA